jgi:hypothetical protein
MHPKENGVMGCREGCSRRSSSWLRCSGWNVGCAPFPAPLSPRAGCSFRFAPDRFSLTRRTPVAQSRCQHRYAVKLFAFGPECRSRSLRNQRSPSPESSLDPAAAGPLCVFFPSFEKTASAPSIFAGAILYSLMRAGRDHLIPTERDFDWQSVVALP